MQHHYEDAVRKVANPNIHNAFPAWHFLHGGLKNSPCPEIAWEATIRAVFVLIMQRFSFAEQIQRVLLIKTIRQETKIMKTIFTALFYCVGLIHLHAADEPLIPVALNAILPKIHARMTIREVEAVLAPAYPKVKSQMGNWSGQTGYIEYKLDERYSVSVSSISREGKEVVHDEILIYLYDWQAKRRLDLKVYEWEKQEDKQPAPKSEEPNKPRYSNPD